MSPQTTLNPKPAIFLIAGTSLTGSFEAFHSSLDQSAGELWLKELIDKPCAKILARAGLKALPVLEAFT